MKYLAVFLATTVTVFSNCHHADNFSQSINPLIGDVSYVAKFGSKPDANADDDLRIKTHLEYVEQLLRQKDVSAMPKELQQKRMHVLNLLHDYWNAGIFPRNYDYASQRKPCFIDKEGRICAVGYLVEQTAGRAVTGNINAKHQYDEIFEMNDEAVDNWIASSGLSKQECAMIQPTYEGSNSTRPINAITLVFFGQANLGLNIANSIHLVKGSTKRGVPIAGLVTGGLQLTVGTLTSSRGNDERAFAFANICFGATTMILSAVNLQLPKKQKSLVTLNVGSLPLPDNRRNCVVFFLRRF